MSARKTERRKLPFHDRIMYALKKLLLIENVIVGIYKLPFCSRIRSTRDMLYGVLMQYLPRHNLTYKRLPYIKWDTVCILWEKLRRYFEVFLMHF